MPIVVMPLVIGCTSSETPETVTESPMWDGKVQQWGTLREVMHGEAVEGQIRLSAVLDKPDVFGIGAPGRLKGEILIADSVAWLSKLSDDNCVETRRSESDEDSAVFLAVAQVPRWTEVQLEKDVSAEDFDDFLQQTINQAGLGKLDTVPLVVQGRFPKLELHVLNGQCPFAEVKTEIEGSGPPHRITMDDAEGLLVGFYSETGAGRITHHWTRTHIHALVGPSEKPVVGHVDAVALKAGTIIRVPIYRA